MFAGSVEWDLNEIDKSFEGVNSATVEGGILEIADDNAEELEEENDSERPLPALFTPQPKTATFDSSSPDPTTARSNLKRKSVNPLEEAKALSATFAHARLQSENIKADSKRARLELDLKNKLEIERICAEQQNLQRLHELELMDCRITLARLQAEAGGGHAQMMFPNNGFGGMGVGNMGMGDGSGTGFNNLNF